MQAEKRIGCYTVDVFSSTSAQDPDRLPTLTTVEPSIAFLQGPLPSPFYDPTKPRSRYQHRIMSAPGRTKNEPKRNARPAAIQVL